MRFPEFLKEKGTIGLCAPSFGIAISPYTERYLSAIQTFQELGYSISETASTRILMNGESAPAEVRAKEFMDCYLDDSIDFIISVAGGERMMEILPFLDFEKIKKAKPKYFMGYSDNTCLTFTLTTLADVASIYGVCMPSFGMKPWDKSIEDAYQTMIGHKSIQESYSFYEGVMNEYVVGEELNGYQLTNPVEWSVNQGNHAEFSGRLIGGCLDVLQILVGTEFDQVDAFAKKHDEGIVWYLEACDLTSLSTLRALWQMKQANWFSNCKGFLFGRPIHTEVCFDISQQDAVRSVLSDLNIPIIFDTDIGHVAPMMTLINGSIVTVKVADKKGTIEMSYR